MDNRISLKKLEILCLVVDLGGVGRAAERLQVSQPVVTAHLRLLQDRLGVELLHREGQQMRLTEAGVEVYRWAREVLGRSRELARTIDELADGSSGAVAVASSMSVGSYLLPRVLGLFGHERPEARITLHVSDAEDAQRFLLLEILPVIQPRVNDDLRRFRPWFSLEPNPQPPV